MNEMDMMSPEKVAAKYNGDKQKIGQAAQMGLLNPTVAVMAGMFIDRMRGAAAQEQAPQSTVAQDTMAAPQAAPAGLGAISQAPTEGGLEALPTPNLDNAEYAGGGIVAFQGGDLVRGVGTETYPTSLSQTQVDPATLRAYYLSKGMPLPPELMTSEDRLKTDKPGFDYYYKAAGIEPPKFPKLTSDAPLTGSLMASELGMDGTQLSEIPRGVDSIDTLRAKAAASRASMSPENRARYDENISGIKRIAEDVAPKGKQTEAKATETKTTEGVNVKAADKAITDYAKKVRELNKEFGVSDEPDAKARASLEKYKEKLNKDLDKAGALSLVQAGLGIAGGKSQYALQNLAGATPAIEQYSKAMSQIREGEKGILDSEAKLDQAADARARGNVKQALELEKDARDLAIRERQVSEQAGLRREIEGGRQEQRYLNMMQNARRTAMNNIVQARKLDITAMDQNQLATLEREADALLSRDPAYQSMYKKIYGEAYAPTPMASAAVDYGKMYGLTPKKQ